MFDKTSVIPEKSSSKPKGRKQQQAIAIAMKEAGRSKKKVGVKKGK